MISIRATTACIGFAACPSSLSTNQPLTISPSAPLDFR